MYVGVIRIAFPETWEEIRSMIVTLLRGESGTGLAAGETIPSEGVL